MHFDGRGVTQDFVLAHKWLNLVATLPHLSSETDKKFVNSARHKRAAVTNKKIPAQIANAQKSAREWMPTPWTKAIGFKSNWIAKLAAPPWRLLILSKPCDGEL